MWTITMFATTNVTIEKVCINYDDITIIPGTTSLEQLDIGTYM